LVPSSVVQKENFKIARLFKNYPEYAINHSS